MNEEEKEAIECLKNKFDFDEYEWWLVDTKSTRDEDYMKLEKSIEIVLNLLSKKDKEIKQLKEDISDMYCEKVVRNLLAEYGGLSQIEMDEILS